VGLSVQSIGSVSKVERSWTSWNKSATGVHTLAPLQQCLLAQFSMTFHLTVMSGGVTACKTFLWSRVRPAAAAEMGDVLS
jgi:phosphodiesterase/alkaline phosphatase D-like protein